MVYTKITFSKDIPFLKILQPGFDKYWVYELWKTFNMPSINTINDTVNIGKLTLDSNLSNVFFSVQLDTGTGTNCFISVPTCLLMILLVNIEGLNNVGKQIFK